MPREAMRSGVNLVCADRVGESIVPNSPFARTVPQSRSPQASPVSMLAPGRESRAALDLGQRLGLRPDDPTLPIELLSAANQQKVVVGRWLHLGAKVYVFEDPTAGVDVGAKAEIYGYSTWLSRPAPLSWSCRLISRRSPRCATARWCSTAAAL